MFEQEGPLMSESKNRVVVRWMRRLGRLMLVAAENRRRRMLQIKAEKSFGRLLFRRKTEDF